MRSEHSQFYNPSAGSQSNARKNGGFYAKKQHISSELLASVVKLLETGGIKTNTLRWEFSNCSFLILPQLMQLTFS
jgi:hypothetical protein